MKNPRDLIHKIKMTSYAILLVVAISAARPVVAQDEYMADAQSSCYKQHDAYSCFKYRALRYVSGIASPANESVRSFSDLGGRAVRLVSIDSVGQDGEGVAKEYFEDSRQLPGDSEFDKFIKFGKRQIESFLRSHGITFGLPEGASTISDDELSPKHNEVGRGTPMNDNPRGKKKKLAILVPLLSLLSLVKVKLLLVPILLAVLFIKKLLILAALFLPSILSTLKICKHHHHGHHAQYSSEGAGEYNSGYGSAGYSAYGGAANAGYAKDWAASRAYNSYKQAYDKQISPMKAHNPAFAGNQAYPVTASNQEQ